MKNRVMPTLRKRGFTLMETVLVVAVGLGLIIGGIVFYEQAKSNGIVADRTRAINAVHAEIRKQYDKQPSYAGLSLASLEATSELPGWMLNDILVQPLAGAWPRFVIQGIRMTERECQRVIANQDALGTNIRNVSCIYGGTRGWQALVNYGR